MSDKRFDNENLKAAIDKSGMTREQIAAKVGCDTSSITKYYNGDRYPKTDIIIKLAELFNISTDYLLGVTKIETSLKTDDNTALRISCDYTELSKEAITKIIQAPKQIAIFESIFDSDVNVLNILIESDIFWRVLRYISLMLKYSTIPVTGDELFNIDNESVTLKGAAMSDYFRNNAVNVFSFLIDDIRRLKDID